MYPRHRRQGGFKKAERRFAIGFGATISLSHPQADRKSALRPVCPGDGFFLESALHRRETRRFALVNSPILSPYNRHLNQASTATEPASFPLGTHNAFLFATCNALSFQVVLNSPMILYAKTLGAGATVLGIIAGMTPLLVIFQIPAASYVSRVGYRRFVYAGWGVRVMFIFGLALVPVTEKFLDATTRLALILMLLFGFNLSRGISSCAWLPWITSLIPSTIRGKFLAREAASMSLASFVSFLLSASCLGERPQAGQFAALFAFSGLILLCYTEPRRQKSRLHPHSYSK